jgi:hypothetical protein
MNLSERFRILDGNRTSKLNRARFCSSLTIPTVLPPKGWEEGLTMPQPYSSVASRGVTSLASRMLSALIPLNDAPFFKFALKDGTDSPFEISQYLETLSYQVYRKLISTNLRETVYQALQNLIVTGDVLLMLDDRFYFTNYRVDQYVVQRDVMGEVIEVIHLEYEAIDPDDIRYEQGSIEYRRGFDTYYCQYLRQDDGRWLYRKEDSKGNLVNHGYYAIPTFAVLRWLSVPGENYGRSHCEDILGDLQSLEAYTKSQIEGLAAASSFWVGIDPSGITEVDDIATVSNGSFVSARQADVFTISPAATMNPQIQAASAAVENMRREIGQAFLMTGQAIPSGDRVTATAVRMIGAELETVLGGAFSSIARTLMEPVVKRCIVQMLDEELLDPALEEQFFAKDGTLDLRIITGLQALSRDSDLQKLMQLGEMVRNLPPDAIATFRWDAYASQLITSLGFDAREWVRSEEEVQQMQQQKQQQAAQLNTQQQTAGAIGNSMANVAGQVTQDALQSPDMQAQTQQALQNVDMSKMMGAVQ